MVSNIDHERLVLTGVLIAALVLWGGIIVESTGLYPDGKTAAATALGVLLPAFTLIVLLLYYLTGAFGDDSDA